MEQFAKNLAGSLRRFAMTGIGAVTLTVDKSREIINQLAARGEVSAAEGQAACDDLQKRLTEQVSAFTQKLRADYENLSFEQLLARAQKLRPEQKQRLIDSLAKTPEYETPAPDDESDAHEPSAEMNPQAAAESAEIPLCADAVSQEDSESDAAPSL